MPRANVQAGHTGAVNGANGAPPAFALIAEEGPRERIGEALEEQGLAFTAFDDVEDLLASRAEVAPVPLCAEEDPALIVLWLEDQSSSGPPQQIEPLRRGIEAAQIVVVCADIQRWELRTMLAAGVTGVVLQDRLADTLGPCLQAVRTGQICVPREHWRQIEPPALSTREKQILGLVVMGYMNSQIAEQLFLAESTVKSHLSSAFGKLGVRSRNEAVKLILDTERGLGMGILALGGEPLEATAAAVT
jgi:DNA-binding NarL/FixJ family response regulator